MRGNVKGGDVGGVKSHRKQTSVPRSKCNITETIHSPFLCCKQSYLLSLSSWGFLHYIQIEACHYMIYFQVCLLECCLKMSCQASVNKNLMLHLRATSTSLPGYPDTCTYLEDWDWLHVTKTMVWSIIFKICYIVCLFLIEWIHLPVVLVSYRYNLNAKAHFRTVDWNCGNIMEDILCEEALST